MTTTSTAISRLPAREVGVPPNNQRPTRHQLARDCLQAAEELLSAAAAGHDVVEATEELVGALRVLVARTTPAASRDAREAADVAHSGVQPLPPPADDLTEEEPDDGAGQAYDGAAWGDPIPVPVAPAPQQDRRVWALR